MNAAVHGAEEEGRAVDGLGDCQMAVVLQDYAFRGAEGGGDVGAFVGFEGDAAEGGVVAVVVVEAVLTAIGQCSAHLARSCAEAGPPLDCFRLLRAVDWF